MPAYSLPPNAEDVHLMRVVVRLDLSRQMLEVLLQDMVKAWESLSNDQPTHTASPKPDLWTSPDHSAAHAKARSQQTR